MKKFLILIMAILSIVYSASGQETTGGQWDGNVGIEAGSNFFKGNSTRQKYSYSSGGVSGWGRYRTDKFMIRLDLQCLAKYATTSTTGVTTNANNPDAPRLNFDIKFNDNKIFEESSGVLFEFTPNNQDLFSLNLKQKFNRQDPNKIGISFQNIIYKQNQNDIEGKFYLDVEEGEQSTTDYSINASWNHKFDKPGREITAGMEWALNIKDNPSIWHRMESPMNTEFPYEASYEVPTEISTDSGIPIRTFRITPFNKDNNLNATILYHDKDLFDRPIKVSTLSEDLTYIRVEENQYNRRLFSIGASFRF